MSGLVVALLVSGCSESDGGEKQDGAPYLVVPVPDDELDVIKEADTSVGAGQLYSFVSRYLCLTEPGMATITGAEFDPASRGLKIIDVRVRRPVDGGYGSFKGPLDSKQMGFTADDYSTDTVCAADGGTDDPAWDETGVTVRRTSGTPGKASKIRYFYEFKGESYRTPWYRSHWTIG
ncbi:hypothetical protein AB0N29_01770 [Nocardioides sp. NPDC092400]|uniref:hypothetical protein n=1 Tax=Nocardioides sp. NPDC092400 TaxID=3155196 RepID=UPI00343C828F